MAKTMQEQISKERYDIIMTRYKQYQDTLTDPNKEPVRVFDPLEKKLVEELELIRQVSKELQEKKDEDMRKAAAAASQAEEDAKKAAEEEKKKPEEEKKETEDAEKKE